MSDDFKEYKNPHACIFVSSIPPLTEESSIKEYFSTFGNVIDVNLILDRPFSSASVQFEDKHSADNAISQTDHIFNSSKIIVERAKVPRTLFLARLNPRLNNKGLRELCQEFGNVENVTIIKNFQTNKSKRCGFVKFMYKEDAEIAKKELKLRKPGWIVEWATSTKDPDMLGVDKYTVYVGGLDPYILNKKAIEDRFSEYGEIEWIKLVNPLNRRMDGRYDEHGHYYDYFPSLNSYIFEGDSKNTNSYIELNVGDNMYEFINLIHPPIFSYAFVKYKKEISAARAIESENGAFWINNRIKVQYCETLEMKLKKKLGEGNQHNFDFPQPLSASQLFVIEEILSPSSNLPPLNPVSEAFPAMNEGNSPTKGSEIPDK